jgi:hypothetical protein
MSDASSVEPPLPTAVAPPKEPGVGRGCLTVVVVAVVLGVIVTLAAGAGQTKPPVEPAGSYIAAHTSVADRIRAAGADVNAALRRADRDPSSRDVDDRLITAAGSALAELGSVGQELATKPVTGTVGDAEVEAFAAANDLRAAVASIARHVRPAAPATLAGLTTDYENAVGEWNDAVRVIWRAGGRSSTAPMIP